MARQRTIKPGFFKNDLLAEMPPSTRLLFIGLWTLADREGRLEDRPKRIKGELFPYDDLDAADIDTALGHLHAAGFILRYTDAELPYIQVVNFLKHQNPHVKEQASIIPVPACTVQAPCRPDAGTVPAQLLPGSYSSSYSSGVPSSPAREAPPSSEKNGADFSARPAAPPAVFDAGGEMATWPDDAALCEAFVRVRRLPRGHYARYIEEFRADIAARDKQHTGRRDLRENFLSWSEIHHRCETQQAPAATARSRAPARGGPADFAPTPPGRKQPF